LKTINIRNITDPNADYSNVVYCAGNYNFWAQKWKALTTMINRSVLANAFKDQDNWAVLYKRWLWSKIRNRRGAQYQALNEIATGQYEALACWCAPKACHCDIILKACDWIIADQNEAHDQQVSDHDDRQATLNLKEQ